MKKKHYIVLILGVCLITFVYKVWPQNYYLNKRIHSIKNGKDFLINEVINDFNVCVIDEEYQLKVIVYKKMFGNYEVYKEKTFVPKQEDIISYIISHIVNDTYLYIGTLNQRDIESVVFLGDEWREFVNYNEYKLFCGITSNFTQDGIRYQAFDVNGNMIYSK